MKRSYIFLVSLLLSASFLFGQEKERTADEIAKELANPNSSVATLNFKSQFRWFDGDLPHASDQSGFTLLAQPGFPFIRKNGDMVLWRPAIPLIFSQPVFDPSIQDFKTESGLGDIGFDLAYGRTTKTGIIWAVGGIFTLPTATNDLGSKKWSAGPEFLIGKLSKKYVLGIYPNHQWDYAGSGNRSINLTSGQVFALYLPGGGWSIGSSPLISYDWNSDTLTLPLNLTVGKTVIWGKQPWKLSLEANYYVERSDAFGPDCMIGINISPVVQNPMAKWFQ